jgi:UDP-N-acetylmuramate: L-alanyl-gamma-D-glutamyl-meso-diaminopimelate ligase
MNIHFIAIGGAAMHNLAIALKNAGHVITGSDDEIFDPAKTRLQNSGILPEQIGWFPEKLKSTTEAVVLGMHAKADNPELKRAKELGLPVYSYPDYLYQVWKNKTRIVIGGSHGKTTITSMILHAFRELNFSSDYMVGALLDGFENMVSISEESSLAVMEGDEYTASILDLRPKFHLYKADIALISGIAWDHINVFPTYEKYKEQFSLFIDSMETGGFLVYNADDDEVRILCESHARTDISKIPYRVPHYSVENEYFTVLFENERYPLQIFGKHNLSNLSGACEVAHLAGIRRADFWRASRSFSGASNRLQLLAGGERGVCYKDFAHSPSKVKATLNAFLEKYSNKQVTAVFELHTFSTLNQEFLPGYRHALNGADRAAVFFDPHVLQLKRMPELSPEFVKSCFGRADLQIITEREELRRFLSDTPENSALLLMSSGNWGGLPVKEIAESICT